MPNVEISLPTPNGFSQVAAVDAGHRLVWTSGQIAVAEDGNVIGPGDWEAQTRAVMRNVGIALEAGGATWRDVFKLTIFVVDTAELPVVRSVRDEFIDTERPPTSTLVKVAGLVLPELLVEIEAVAAVIA